MLTESHHRQPTAHTGGQRDLKPQEKLRRLNNFLPPKKYLLLEREKGPEHPPRDGIRILISESFCLCQTTTAQLQGHLSDEELEKKDRRPSLDNSSTQSFIFPNKIVLYSLLVRHAGMQLTSVTLSYTTLQRKITK